MNFLRKIASAFDCICFCSNSNEKKINIKKNNNSIKNSLEMEKIDDKSIIKIIIIGDENNEEVIKIKEHIEDLFFAKKIIKKSEFIKIYQNSYITLEITSIPYDNLNYYSQNKYNYVISLCSKKEGRKY